MATGGAGNQAGGGGDSAGTLFVDIDARLDKFDEKMRRLEQEGPQSAKAVEDAMASTAGATQEVQQAADESSMSLLELISHGHTLKSLFDRFGESVGVFGRLMRFLRGAASGAASLIRVLGSLSAILGIVGQTIRVIRNLPDILRSIANIDLGAALRRSMEAAQQTIGETVAEFGLLRETVGRLANELGVMLGRGDILGDLDRLNEGIERAENRLSAMRHAADAAGNAVEQAASQSRQAFRDLMMERAEGPVEGARLQSAFRLQDIERNANQRLMEARARFSSRRQELRSQLEAGDIEQGEFDSRDNVLSSNQERIEQRIRQERDAALRATREANQIRMQEARQQAQERQQQAQQNAQAEAEARMRATQDALSRERELRMRMAGRTAEAEAEAIRRQFDQRIQRALEDNNRALAASLERRKQIRVRAAKEEAEAEAEARREAEREEQRQRLSDLRDVQAQIEAARERAAGDDEDARRVEIGRRFERRINQAESDGRDRLAESLRSLRDLRLAAVGRDNQAEQGAQRGDFQEVGRARIAAGGPGSDEQRVHDPENVRQTEILSEMLRRMRRGRGAFGAG